jgi:hypothetical protein
MRDLMQVEVQIMDETEKVRIRENILTMLKRFDASIQGVYFEKGGLVVKAMGSFLAQSVSVNCDLEDAIWSESKGYIPFDHVLCQINAGGLLVRSEPKRKANFGQYLDYLELFGTPEQQAWVANVQEIQRSTDDYLRRVQE